MPRCLVALAAALALAGCTSTLQPATLHIEGHLDGPAAGTLDAGAEWVVELRDAASQRVLAEQRGRVSARQPPIGFELSLDAARLDPAQRLAVRGAVQVQGRVTWLSEPRPVAAVPQHVDLGSLRLQPYVSPGGFASTLDCGRHRLTLGYIGEQLRLSVGPRVLDLAPVPGSRPQRFERAGEPSTFVQFDAQGTTVSLQGQRLPPCVSAAAPR